MCQTIIVDEGYPRRLSLVRLIDIPTGTLNPDVARMSKDKMYIFFGEIPNMPGHCVVADYTTGQIHAGCHTGSFIELSVCEMELDAHTSVHGKAVSTETRES